MVGERSRDTETRKQEGSLPVRETVATGEHRRQSIMAAAKSAAKSKYTKGQILTELSGFRAHLRSTAARWGEPS